MLDLPLVDEVRLTSAIRIRMLHALHAVHVSVLD